MRSAWLDRLPWAALCLGVLLAGGCMRQRVVHDGWGWARDSEWATPSSTPQADDKARTGANAARQRAGWTIRIAEFDGRRGRRQAQEVARLVQRHSRMAQVWVEQVPAGRSKAPRRSRVLAGRYVSNDDWGALEDLNHLRFVQVDQTYPFAGAELIPLGDPLDADDSEYDLKRYVGMFTLQIGFYDDAAGPQFRKIAEEAVKSLREKGEQAYFYHGPNRSLICLGLFTENDFSEANGTRTYGPRIKALQEKHPYNLANGYTLVEKQQGQVIGDQPSFLVRVF